jgi:hypothetical protein
LKEHFLLFIRIRRFTLFVYEKVKKQVAILLLVCYSLALAKPLVPVVSDFLAHTFWKSEHLATVHYENGKYHVHLDIEKAGKEQQNDQKKTTEKDSSVHLNSICDYVFLPRKLSGLLISGKQQIVNTISRTISSPPPWHC